MPHIVFIHGANSSSASFNYIKTKIKPKNQTSIDYQSVYGFDSNLEYMLDVLSPYKKLFIIAHSLGGIYALHLSNKLPVVGAVTISTPYNGSSLADWARYMFPNYKLFKDVGTKSNPVNTGKEIKINIPWTQLVSTTGRVPWMLPNNDGVVTIRSQTSRPDMELIELPYNHYDIMCAPDTVSIIKDRYAKLVDNT